VLPERSFPTATNRRASPMTREPLARRRHRVRPTSTVNLADSADVDRGPGGELSRGGEDRWSCHPVLAEQTAAVDPGRLGESVGVLVFDEMRRVDAALRIVMDL
jgi:hypothetical protein